MFVQVYRFEYCQNLLGRSLRTSLLWLRDCILTMSLFENFTILAERLRSDY